MVQYVISGHIYHPKTGFIKRRRGIASGSVFTNLVDSLANVFILNYCLPKNTGKSNPIKINFKVGGDDNVLYSKNKFDYLAICRNANVFLHMILNIDEKHVFERGVQKCHFLGSL